MSTPSPLCEIKVGAAAYVTAVGGVSLTTSTTIIIRLADQTGVDSWLIECVSTDETSSASSVTSSLTINSSAKTATFTSPSAGKTYRFRSRVNGGIDQNGIARPTYETTFILYTLTGTGYRVLAVDETFEASTTFGWVSAVNAAIRAL